MNEEIVGLYNPLGLFLLPSCHEALFIDYVLVENEALQNLTLFFVNKHLKEMTSSEVVVQKQAGA